jgi:hypothetical protein
MQLTIVAQSEVTAAWSDAQLDAPQSSHAVLSGPVPARHVSEALDPEGALELLQAATAAESKRDENTIM